MKYKTDQRGIALVLTLWVTTLLTVIAVSFVFSVRTDTLLAQNLVAGARAQALADAGIQRALYELLKPSDDTRRWKGDGATHSWDFDGAQINVTILEISAKIDLNFGSDVLLKGLLKRAGLDERQSSALLDAILDWRDQDDLRRPNGAEAAEYRSAGLKYGPANAQFETVDELQRVLGMTPLLYAKLAEALTVDARPTGLTLESTHGGIDPTIAPREVLLALPGVNEAQVDDYLAQRRDAQAKNLPAPAFAGATGFIAAKTGSSYMYSVSVDAALPDGTRFIREAVMKLNHNTARKIAFLSWKEGVATKPK